MYHYVLGINYGFDREKPVRYFAMGDNRWREADAWPPAAKPTPYYFADSGKTNRGSLRPDTPPENDLVRAFISDPEKPVMNRFDSSGAHDYRELAKREDVLTFDSEPLEKEVEVTGPIRAKVFLSCDCRDLDLWVRLLDVAPDGTAFNLMSPGLDVQRVSYRDLSKGRQLLSPDQIYEVRLENLITSNVFQTGHRIRAQVSASFFSNFSRNLQTGELETVSAKTRKARVSIHTGKAHPSQIILPIVPR